MGIIGGIKGVFKMSVQGKTDKIEYPQNMNYQKIQDLMDKAFADSKKICSENDCDSCYYDSYFLCNQRLNGKEVFLKVWTTTYKDGSEDDSCYGAYLLLPLSEKELNRFKKEFVKANNLTAFPLSMILRQEKEKGYELGGNPQLLSYFLLSLGLNPNDLDWKLTDTKTDLVNEEV